MKETWDGIGLDIGGWIGRVGLVVGWFGSGG